MTEAKQEIMDSKSEKSKKKRSFNDTETELLISLWQQYPCLYSKSDSFFKDQNQKEICRREIAEKLKDASKAGDEPLTSKCLFHQIKL